MRRKLVVGNWKMHGNAREIGQLVPSILSCLAGEKVAGERVAEVAVCPPFVYLGQVGALLQNSAVALGAQNMAVEAQGAFTGEISAAMLADLACRFVIVGHSERRSLYGESSETVAAKAVVALAHGLTPIVCVGETLAERESGATLGVVGAQLAAITSRLTGEELAKIVVAYEPVWAIGTGQTASPAEAQAVHAFIRSCLGEAGGSAVGAIRLLYGGSVKADNAAELFSQNDIDGGLVGGASLCADQFIAICRAAES